MSTATDKARSAEFLTLCAEMLEQRRLIVVSNRGPVEHHVTSEGQLQARRGSGGLVAALSSLTRNVDFTWVASAMGEGDRRALESSEGASFPSSIPGHRFSLRYVTTPRRVYHKYYNVLCNPLLWFLQHYMWNASYTPNVDHAVHDAWENGYVAVNRAFADAVIAEAAGSSEQPYVMVHDYHLYLVPGYVRQELPKATIQHYLHIPWPGPSYWQLLPSHMCRSICESLCSADVVGFQTTRDAQSFLATCSLFLPKTEVDFGKGLVEFNGHKTTTHAYPLSIDVEEIRRISNSPRASEYKQRLMPLCAERTIVRVDRAEPNKNIVRGFRAYDRLLERYSELRGKVTFLAFLVPSRTHIRQYQRYLDEIQQVAGEINGNYGSSDWQPVQLFLENNYTQAIAGLCQYDVLLVNAVIDGMNLIAKEGPVVNAKDGVLVLTETVGAYEQLADGALTVAPTDVEGTTERLYEALTMSDEERARRQAILVEAIEREDLLHWLHRQFQDIRGMA